MNKLNSKVAFDFYFKQVKASEILNGNLQLDGNISQLHQFYVQHLHLQKNEVEAARAEVHMLKQQLTIETETRKHAQV